MTLNPEAEHVRNGYWMPTAVFDRDLGITRESLQAALNPEGIDARVFFHPLSSLSMFESCPRNVNAYDIPERAINLPSYHDMTQVDLDRVTDAVQRLYGASSHAR
ncbi:DegT/DnrJ/EryC1/StrS aminotransferase family protein [compost metagenome]